MATTEQYAARPADLDLFLAVGAAFISGGLPGGLPDAAGRWQALEALAVAHRMVPVVWSVLARLEPGPEDRDAAASLRREAMGIAASSLRLTAELLRLLDIMGRAGITALPNKGPALAAELYGEVSLRTFGDLDLLVSPGQVMDALDVLRGAGYRPATRAAAPPPDGLLRRLAATKRGEMPLTHRESGIAVDLHWTPVGFNMGPGLDLAADLDPEPLLLAGRPVPHLRREALLTLLAVHGYKHGWLRLNWLFDLALLLTRWQSDMDWERLAASLGDAESRRAVLSAVLLAASLLGAPPGDGPRCLDRDGHGEAARAMAARLEGRLRAAPLDTAEDPMGKVLPLMLMASPGPWGRLRTTLRLLGSVGYEDLDRRRLWPPLFFLYRPLRLARLAGKYALGGREQ